MSTVYAECQKRPFNKALFQKQEAILKSKFLFSGFGGEGKTGCLKLNTSDNQIIEEIKTLVDSWRPTMQWGITVIG